MATRCKHGKPHDHPCAQCHRGLTLLAVEREHAQRVAAAKDAVIEAAVRWEIQWNAGAPNRDTAALYMASTSLSTAVDALLALDPRRPS